MPEPTQIGTNPGPHRLERLVADEYTLIQYYRAAGSYQQLIRMFAAAAMSKCMEQLPANVTALFRAIGEL
jgi:hypothetical protein